MRMEVINVLGNMRDSAPLVILKKRFAMEKLFYRARRKKTNDYGSVSNVGVW